MKATHEGDVQIPVRERLRLIEVAGTPVRCIASNIRAKDAIDWGSFHTTDGIGFEGNMVLGRIESVGARREMEYLRDGEIDDLPLMRGDRNSCLRFPRRWTSYNLYYFSEIYSGYLYFGQ